MGGGIGEVFSSVVKGVGSMFRPPHEQPQGTSRFPVVRVPNPKPVMRPPPHRKIELPEKWDIFQDWKNNNEMEYENEREEKHRFDNFKKTMVRVEKYNTFLHCHSDFSEEEFNDMYVSVHKMFPGLKISDLA